MASKTIEIMVGTIIKVSTGTLTIEEKKGKDYYVVSYKSNVNSRYDKTGRDRIEMTEKEVKRLMRMSL